MIFVGFWLNKNRGLLEQNRRSESRKIVLFSLTLPEFFFYSEICGKERTT